MTAFKNQTRGNFCQEKKKKTTEKRSSRVQVRMHIYGHSQIHSSQSYQSRDGTELLIWQSLDSTFYKYCSGFVLVLCHSWENTRIFFFFSGQRGFSWLTMCPWWVTIRGICPAMNLCYVIEIYAFLFFVTFLHDKTKWSEVCLLQRLLK